MNTLKKANGVTLPALIITIIVLLILAGIVIGIINANSETLDKADDAKIYTELKQLQEALESYKITRYSNKGLLKGDFSGQATNTDLVLDGLIKQYSGIDIDKEDIVRASETEEDKTDRTIGVIAVEELGKKLKMEIGSKLGENITSYFPNPGTATTDITPETGKGNLAGDFTDVFVLDVEDNDLYYTRDGKVWKILETENTGGSGEEEEEEEDDDEYGLSVTYSSNKYTNAQIKSKLSANSWIDDVVTATYKWGEAVENKSVVVDATHGIYNQNGTQSVRVDEGTASITASFTGINGKQINSLIKVDTIVPIINVTKVDSELGENKLRILVEDLDSNDANVLSSGIKSAKYAYSSTEDEPSAASFTNINQGEAIIDYDLNDASQKYLFVKATDNAGNMTSTRKKIETVAKVTISGKSDYFAISMQDAIDYAKNNCTTGVQASVYLLKDIEDEAITTYAGQNIVLDLQGHSMLNTSESLATITNRGSLKVIDSTNDEEENIAVISSENTVAVQNNSGATFILGNSDEAVSLKRPALVGYDYGLANNGTFNFYDGTITGSIHGNQGSITQTAEGYVAISRRDVETNTETVFLGRLADYEARIGPTYYFTIAEAIEDATENNEVCLVRNCALTAKLTVEEGKTVNLNMNGFDISFNGASGYLIDNYGTLNILSVDYSDRTTLKDANMINTVGPVINNTENATLTVSKAKINTTKEAVNAINNYGTLHTKDNAIMQTYNSCSVYNVGTWTCDATTLNGGIILNAATGVMYLNNPSSGTELRNTQGGIIHLAGGSVGTYNNNSSAEGNEITGGTMYNYNNNSGADISITGGTITNQLTNASANRLDLSNLTVKNVAGAYCGEMSFTNCTITGTLNVYTSSTTYVNNCTVNAITNQISNNQGGSVVIDGENTTISSISNNGTIILKNGTVTGSISATSAGLIELGENGTDAPKMMPVVRGGINVGARSMHFYDGKVYGNPPITAGEIQIPEGCEIIPSTENGKTVWSLTNDPEPIAQITKNGTTKSYKKLQLAIDDCTDGEATTIEILRNQISSENPVISQNQIVTIDLGTHTMTPIVSTYITNNGNLTVKNGTISTNIGNIFNNTATGNLTIQSGTYNASNSSKSTVINTGHLDMNDGTLTGGVKIVNMSGAGSMTMTGGTVSGTNRTIYNTGSGRIELSGGTVRANAEYEGGKGYRLNSYSDDCAIFNNNSNSTIEVKTGATVTNLGVGIYNYAGTLKVTGGIVQSQTWSYRNGRVAVYNHGTLEITAGYVKAPGTYGGAIYNEGTATLSGTGEVSSTTSQNGTPISNYGTLNIYGGQILGYKYGISNSGTMNMSDGLVQAATPYNDTAIVYVSGTARITGGTIKYNQTAPTTTASYAIRITSSSATVTLGEKDGNVNQASPEIIGNTIGLYNSGNGTFNFYDGVIKGKTAYTGTYADKEPESDVLTSTEGEYQVAKLGVGYVAAVNGTSYYTLHEAFDHCPTDGTETTVEILRNCTIISAEEIPSTKNIVLDLKSYQMVAGVADLFDNNGRLRITRSDAGGTLLSTKGTIVKNEEGATVVLDTVPISMTNTQLSVGVIDNYGSLQINSGSISTSGSNNAIRNSGIGTITMTGGTVSADKRTILSISSGKTEISGGTVSANSEYDFQGGNYAIGYSDDCAIFNNNGNSIIEIKTGGTVTNCGVGIYNYSGTVKVSGGTVQTTSTNYRGGRTALYNRGIAQITAGYVKTTGGYGRAIDNDGTVTLSGTGEINSTTSPNATPISTSGTLNINGGQILGERCGISNSGTLNMTDGLVQATNSTNDTAILHMSGGTATITGGRIKNANPTSSVTAYGIRMNSNNATLTLGTKDGNVSTTIPEIIGNTYAVYNLGNGVFNFYDGVLKAYTLDISGSITRVEEDHKVQIDEVDGLKVATLAYESTDTQAAFVNGRYYRTLKEAIESCPTGSKSYVILVNGSTVTENITIAANQNIEIDLSGYTINGASGVTLINNGALSISDSSSGHTGQFNLTVTGNAPTNN